MRPVSRIAPISRAACAALALALMLLVGGCGSTTSHAGGPTLEEIRRRARELPNDPAAQFALAEAELLMPEGDSAEAAPAAIARALELAPDDVRLHFLHALERGAHGHMREALDEYLRTLELAQSSRDPLAPALAEISASALEELDDGVPGFTTRVSSALAPIHGDARGVGLAARHTAGDLLIDLAYRRGSTADVDTLRQAQGCPASWRVIGPFGPRQLLGFDGAYPPEEAGPLAERYDLGPSRGERATRTIEPRGCMLHLGNGPTPGPGSTYAEATFHAASAGAHTLRLETPNTVEVWVDDVSVARVDRRSESAARVTFHTLELSAGEHRILIESASRHPNPVLIASIVPASGPADAPVEGQTPLAELARAMRAMARADYVGARQSYSALATREGATAVTLEIATAIALSDPLTGGEFGHDEARRLLPLAAERDANVWYPAFQLARLESDDLEAVSVLRAAAERWPEVLIIPLTLIDAYEARGWDAQGAAAIAAARAAVPDACRPLRAELNDALRRARHAEVGRFAEQLVACDARSDSRLTHLARQRRWDEAQAELTRLSAFEPEHSRLGVLDTELTLARAQGQSERVQALLTQLAELTPRNETVVLLEADYALAAGDAQAARARIERALREDEESNGELRRVLRAIGGASPVEPYRLDGAQIIRDFESSARTYDAPKVLVLDYTVTRVFEDGSSLELTHNVIRLQSDEAVDQEGEFEVPEGAQLLTLRTVKADGTRLEPDEIQGKDTISMPNLAVGDYVEFEYIRSHAAPAGFPRGALGDRFYFQSFEVPFDRSELTVVVPASMEPTVDTRGPAPETETRVEGDLRILHWRVQESRPRTPEPDAVSAREYLPSVYWAWRADWPTFIEGIRDVLVDRDVRDPAHEALVREIVGTERSTPEAKARRIYAWVLENIEDNSDVFGQAATMIHSRTGNRARVLAYLLRIAGVEADLALARSFAEDATQSELADDDTYHYLAVRMQGSAGPIWLWAGARGAPFGFLPLAPIIRGQGALMLTPEAEQVTISDPPAASDAKRVEVDVRMEEDGSAHVEVIETYAGAPAVGWRSQLENVPAAQLEMAFSQRYVALQMPGARMTSLRITGREDPEQPLVIHYEFDVAEVGRQERDGIVVPGLFPARLGASLARLAHRETTQVLPGGVYFDAIVRVHLPAGAAAPELGPARELESGTGGTATWRASTSEGVITIERSVRVPRARVTPEQYDAFAQFCRAVDEADTGEMRIRLD